MAVVTARVEYHPRQRMYEATVTVDASVVWRRWYHQEGIAWKWAKYRKRQLKKRIRQEVQQ